MAVFTYYVHGTRDTLAKTYNIITEFYKASKATEPNKVAIIDGPDMFGKKVFPKSHQGAQELIEWLKQQKEECNSINLTGFSRGAVMCIRIANILKQEQKKLEHSKTLTKEKQTLLNQLKNIKLNLFLIDPVAGFTDKSHYNGRNIPDNVDQCLIILQKDECRRDFKPHDMSRILVENPQKTKLELLPMYGNHTDTTLVRKKNMASGAKIIWHTLYRFLIQNKSEFKYLPKISSIAAPVWTLKPLHSLQELLHHFSSHHDQRIHFYQSGVLIYKFFDGMPIPRVERTLNRQMEYYVKNSDFFINQLERELLKLTYPKTFNYLFEQNIPDPRFLKDSHCRKNEVIAELQQIKNEEPSLFKRLKTQDVRVTEEQIFLEEPGGYSVLEPCTTLLQIVPEYIPESIKEQAACMNKLATLEKEIYRITFQYEREKSELNFSRKRRDWLQAQHLRQEILALMKAPGGNVEDREGKYQQVLDTLEAHYKKLILGYSTSHLTTMMKRILACHGRVFEIHRHSLANDIVLEFINASFFLVQFAVEFIGHLGYLGEAVFFTVGYFLETLGIRANAFIGDPEGDFFITLAKVMASLLQGAGFIIKHSFGLKPLTELLASNIRQAKIEIIYQLNETTITKKGESFKSQEKEQSTLDLPELKLTL